MRPPAPLWRRDVAASLVVFLVALPLCVGIAVASGVPAELGLITGIVGALVTGLLPGSTLQVSGPAAGLIVLVYEAVHTFGLPVLGVIVLAAGLLQILMGALRLGRWFRAISFAVVEGMLAGIGLVLIAGQLYAMVGARGPGSGLAKLAGLPLLLADSLTAPRALAGLAVGAGTIAVLILWRRMPARIRVVPAPLVAVAAATAATALLGLPIATIEVHGLFGALQLPDGASLGRLLDVEVIGTVLALTLIASAASLFSAAAVDRMHDLAGIDYDRELMAQGAGNLVCGVLGALPITVVIVRSAANVQAGARSRLSRAMHGVWLLLFAALLPNALGLIPVAALAGVLVHASFRLLPIRALPPLWRAHRGEALILVATALSIVTLDLFQGVLIGLALAVAKTAWQTSHTQLEVQDTAEGAGEGAIRVRVSGNATFLRLPKILGALEALPRDRAIELDLSALTHLDHACQHALSSWAARHRTQGAPAVRLSALPIPAGVSGSR